MGLPYLKHHTVLFAKTQIKSKACLYRDPAMLLAFAPKVFTQSPKDRGGANRRLYLLGFETSDSYMAIARVANCYNQSTLKRILGD